MCVDLRSEASVFEDSSMHAVVTDAGRRLELCIGYAWLGFLAI
jgi:hypothetical protein